MAWGGFGRPYIWVPIALSFRIFYSRNVLTSESRFYIFKCSFGSNIISSKPLVMSNQRKWVDSVVGMSRYAKQHRKMSVNMWREVKNRVQQTKHVRSFEFRVRDYLWGVYTTANVGSGGAALIVPWESRNVYTGAQAGIRNSISHGVSLLLAAAKRYTGVAECRSLPWWFIIW